MIGYGGRGGGGGLGGGGRGGGAHYGPGGGGKGGKGGKGKGGRGSRGKGSKYFLSVHITFNSAARVRVIGPGGSIVKQMQKSTATGIHAPRRDAPESAPTKVSGRTVFSVLHACHLLAAQTRNVEPPGGHECACTLSAGDAGSLKLRARLSAADGQPWLMTPGDGMQSDADAAPFAAIALWTQPFALPPTEEEVDAALDDLRFGLGAAELAIYAATGGFHDASQPDESSGPQDEAPKAAASEGTTEATHQGSASPSSTSSTLIFVYAVGDEAVHTLRSALPALCQCLRSSPRLPASPSATPTASTTASQAAAPPAPSAPPAPPAHPAPQAESEIAHGPGGTAAEICHISD